MPPDTPRLVNFIYNNFNINISIFHLTLAKLNWVWYGHDVGVTLV